MLSESVIRNLSYLEQITLVKSTPAYLCILNESIKGMYETMTLRNADWMLDVIECILVTQSEREYTDTCNTTIICKGLNKQKQARKLQATLEGCNPKLYSF